MALNLRLVPELHDAVRSRAAASGRSQQDVVRDALEAYLRAGEPDAVGMSSDGMPLRSARVPLRRVRSRLRLPRGVSSLDLLDRDDRV